MDVTKITIKNVTEHVKLIKEVYCDILKTESKPKSSLIVKQLQIARMGRRKFDSGRQTMTRELSSMRKRLLQ